MTAFLVESPNLDRPEAYLYLEDISWDFYEMLLSTTKRTALLTAFQQWARGR